MNKKTLLLLVCSLALCCISCRKDGADQEAAMKDPNTIRFWHFWSEPTQKEALLEVVEDFEKEFDCKVHLTELSWNEGKVKLQAAFNSNTAPDVLELGSDWIAQFSSSGKLYQIPDGQNLLANFVDFAQEPARWKGAVYALPWSVDTRVLFVNNDLLQRAGLPARAPQTFHEMQMASERIRMLGGEIYGFGANGSDPNRLYKKILPMFWSYGGLVLNEAGRPTINSAENVRALNQYLALSRSGLIDTQRQLDAAFAQGNIGFWFSGSWLISKIERENPKLNYQAVLMPGVDSYPGYSFAGGEYLAISDASPKKELAMKFLRYMTEGKNALEFCKKVNEAGFPADRKFYNDAYFSSVKFRPVFAQQLEKAKMTPVHPRWLDIQQAIENAVEEALLGQKSAQEALNGAQAEAASLTR